MTKSPAPDLRLPLAMLVIGGVAWGGIFTVNKMAAAAGIPPVAYAFWPVLIAGIGVTLVALIIDRRLGLSRDHLVFYFFSGLANVGFGMIILAYVAARLPAGVVTLAMMVSPTSRTRKFLIDSRCDRIFSSPSFFRMLSRYSRTGFS